MAGVKLEGVRKVYGEGSSAHVAVHGADIEVKEGEFLVLVGPSGCGKSTLLRMVAGLESITEGRVWIGDRDVSALPPKERDIAMVFQNYALYPHMTVFENMAFGLKLRKLPKAEIEQRVRSAAATLGLEEEMERKPRQLSGGQRQRVALGRAIVREPQVFLFDEPLSNLDAKLRVQMRREITRLHRQLGATMIYVTHDQVEAMTMGDRIVVLEAGRIRQVDTPLGLYHHPANRFVAGFIGSPAMNFVEGTVDGRGGQRVVTVPALGVALPVGGRIEGPVVLGIRPENVHVAGGPTRPETGVEVRVVLDVVEPMGNEIILHGSVDGAGLTARVPPQELPEPGSEIALVLDVGKLHLFDAVSGEVDAAR
jgi:multiple sugar transport system ATP-binding protein